RFTDKAGKSYTALSATDGTFTATQLPAAEYDLLIPITGFTLDKYERKGIVLAAGQTAHVDAKLEWSFNLGTPGDDPSGASRDRYRSVSGATPRTSDGHPDLNGVWNGDNDPNPEEASALPWAAALFKERTANAGRDDPSGFCLPGPYLEGPLLYKFVQT